MTSHPIPSGIEPYLADACRTISAAASHCTPLPPSPKLLLHILYADNPKVDLSGERYRFYRYSTPACDSCSEPILPGKPHRRHLRCAYCGEAMPYGERPLYYSCSKMLHPICEWCGSGAEPCDEDEAAAEDELEDEAEAELAELEAAATAEVHAR